MSSPSTHLCPEDLLTHLEWARSLARKLVLDASSADDVVQESFVSALRTPPQSLGRCGPGSLESWATRCASEHGERDGGPDGSSRPRARRPCPRWPSSPNSQKPSNC